MMPSRTFRCGGETRTISYGENPDGTAYIKQESSGDLTRASYGCDVHTVTVTYVPCAEYSSANVADDLARRGDDCYIGDYIDNLTLWEAPFKVDSSDEGIAQRPWD